MLLTEEHAKVMDDLIDKAFLNVTAEKQRIYALDWQHSGFLYDPRIAEDKKSIWVENSQYINGGYYAYFPDYYPDGDYYFFIDEHLQFGYLSHPWRREVWIFGDALLNEFKQIYHDLGWDLLYEFDPA